jgi:hypothetical protein
MIRFEFLRVSRPPLSVAAAQNHEYPSILNESSQSHSIITLLQTLQTQSPPADVIGGGGVESGLSLVSHQSLKAKSAFRRNQIAVLEKGFSEENHRSGVAAD